MEEKQKYAKLVTIYFIISLILLGVSGLFVLKSGILNTILTCGIAFLFYYFIMHNIQRNNIKNLTTALLVYFVIETIGAFFSVSSTITMTIFLPIIQKTSPEVIDFSSFEQYRFIFVILILCISSILQAIANFRIYKYAEYKSKVANATINTHENNKYGNIKIYTIFLTVAYVLAAISNLWLGVAVALSTLLTNIITILAYVNVMKWISVFDTEQPIETLNQTLNQNQTQNQSQNVSLFGSNFVASNNNTTSNETTQPTVSLSKDNLAPNTIQETSAMVSEVQEDIREDVQEDVKVEVQEEIQVEIQDEVQE